MFNLFSVLSVIAMSDYICTRVHLYTIIICTDGMTIVMCPCMLLAAICAVCHWLDVCELWCASVGIMQLQIHLCNCSCPVILLHPPYNGARCGFCLIVLCLSDDILCLIICGCH